MDTLKIVFPNGDNASKEWQEVTDKLTALYNELRPKLKAKIDAGCYDTHLACQFGAVASALVFIDAWTDGASADEIVSRLMGGKLNAEEADHVED